MSTSPHDNTYLRETPLLLSPQTHSILPPYLPNFPPLLGEFQTMKTMHTNALQNTNFNIILNIHKNLKQSFPVNKLSSVKYEVASYLKQNYRQLP